ncbi:MAG: Lrp/AsnC family transcriptional regulator [Deltaproteobacteria bacterium]|nr:Lrp/AsnC family transcriptional regulator [Deltaproteobacteria bacterium]
MKIDQTSIALIKHLRDGRRSFRRIAEAVGVSENTVRSRVAGLEREGLLEISGLVDPEGIPGHRLVLIGVKLGTMELVKKGEEFSRLRGVVSVSVVTGRYDLFLQVLLHDQFGLLEFYTQEVSRIQEVQSVETFVVYKGYNIRVPYVL